MKKKYYADLGIRTALWAIQKQSPFCRMAEVRTDSSRTNDTKPEWIPAEAGLAWAIYERAVFDANGFRSPENINHKLSKDSILAAEHTASTGEIDTPTGKRCNLLELLGIEPEWASGVIAEISSHFNTMLEEGWQPC